MPPVAVEAVWTFRSARTARREPLPLAAVRYAPEGLDRCAPEGLDGFSRARPGSITPLPIWIEGAPARVTSLEVSGDDGTTWQRIPVTDKAATVRNPQVAGFVSLRVTAWGAAGTELTQTIIRAYAVG
ncbi:hypothetical protein [Nonomuraea sp. NPDC049480]|uniref:hypothetical protein n=1 Tax=Nonomuraea sp. NPDC049480 TaxID=3364353 RepID=UPI0037AA2EF0